MKLSIIIPVYNLQDYLSSTLESLKNISFSEDYEIIIVNDGSTDNTESIIKKYQEIMPTIKLINVDNKGVSSARNIGIKEANGEYITFVDGDDQVERDFFQLAVDELDSSSYDFIQVNYCIVRGEKKSYNQFIDEDKIIDNKASMMELFFGDGKKIHNAVWGKVFRTSIVKTEQFDTTLRIAEDQKFVFNVLQKVKKIKLLNYVGYYYYIRQNSTMNSFDFDKQYDSIRVLSYCNDLINDVKINNCIEIMKLELLIGIYDRMIVSKQDCEMVHKQIKQIIMKNYNIPSKNLRIRVRIIKLNRKLYELVVIIKHMITD